VTGTAGGPDDIQDLIEDLVQQMAGAPGTGRLSYVIWRGRIAGGARGWSWRKYGRSCPHVRHAHLSIKASERENVRPWKVRPRGG
jgi:hypothetical protein